MIKQFIKSLLNKMGYDLRRYNFSSSIDAQFIAMLDYHKINLIFDVGANIGQFGKTLRALGYGGRIVSFEPLSNERSQLLEASKDDPLWDVAPQAAIGSNDGEIDIYISANSQSSSALNMLETHSTAAPESCYIGKERVNLYKLDTLATEYIQIDSVVFLKIDTQGFEDQVLMGASCTLEKAAGLQLELSLVPLYEGQKLFDELNQKVNTLGFNLWTLSPVFVNSLTGRLLQVDATFFKNERWPVT
jgi:FkbM family methyltransferase